MRLESLQLPLGVSGGFFGIFRSSQPPLEEDALHEEAGGMEVDKTSSVIGFTHWLG